MKRPTSRYVKTDDGVSIGYQVFGEGPYDLVINDGWMSNLDANWEYPEWAAFDEALAKRSRVIKFDRRGFGISDRPNGADEVAVEKAMDDMRAVMDAVRSQRAVVYGFEDGAAVSLLFAASYPERVTALVLVSPMVRYLTTEDFPWGFSAERGREWLQRIESQWGTAEFWRFNLDTMSGADSLDEDDLERLARWTRLCASPAAALAIERAAQQVDVRALLPSVRVPTLVMLKEGDRDSPQWGAAPWVAEQIPGARFVELPGPEHWLEGKDTQVFAEIDAFVGAIHAEEADFDRYLATVLFTDIVGSTEHAAEIGDRGWREIVQQHHAAVRSMLTRYRGTEIDTAGDGFFASFDGPARAVRCAEQIAEAVRPLGIEIRAGVHTGEVQDVDGKVGGLAVSIGARVAAIAGPSEVLVSQTVKDLVAGSGLAFEDAGEHELKGVPDRWHLYRVAG